MALFNRELHLWTITSWSAIVGPHGHSFEIWVSQKFLKACGEIQYDPKKAQEVARIILRNAGYKVQDYQNFLHFGKWGLEQIDAPGDGCELHLIHQSDEAFLRRGGIYSPHNVDNERQQSVLMAMWLFWAHFVEGEIWRKTKASQAPVNQGG